MDWIIGGVVIVVILVFFAFAGSGDEDTTDDKEKSYRWGDELHEYSYRHPWEDD